MKTVLISPSTDPCPIKQLGQYAKKMENAGADFLHCDIMDGKFVERKTYDSLVFALLSKSTNLPLDVHLMVADPTKHIKEYAKYGAKNITIHYECFNSKIELINTLQSIRQLGCNAGISIDAGTEVRLLDTILPYVDLVLVMSVNAGKSGQEFLKSSLTKISYLNKKRAEFGYKFLIEVDGGINTSNASIVAVSGADILVSGSAIYNSLDYKKTISILKGFSW